ncbi:MAG: aminoacyl-tRNA hydrolase [Synergistaceae bacterium]|jgi:PTH1 family peptidyl-tRNA hydrolase|nr:aminoacyl-tRNA hydrolase [Synergistaceae bacterium]
MVVGLGNPGPEYAWSRHNAGWLVIDSFIRRIGLGEPRMKFGGAFWLDSAPDGQRIALLKPFTYMNLSGKSVIEAARYYGIAPDEILVVFDDVAIPFGKLRYRDKGSAGGQKGMASILGALGTLEVPRIRIGVGAPGPRMEMPDWVLGRFPSEQRKLWPEIEDLAWESLGRWMRGDAGEGFTVQIRSGES